MSTCKVYRIDNQVLRAFGAHGIRVVKPDSARVRRGLKSGRTHTMAGLKFQPIEGDKFRVYDVRDGT